MTISGSLQTLDVDKTPAFGKGTKSLRSVGKQKEAVSEQNSLFSKHLLIVPA
jgi:hypothetical protein